MWASSSNKKGSYTWCDIEFYQHIIKLQTLNISEDLLSIFTVRFAFQVLDTKPDFTCGYDIWDSYNRTLKVDPGGEKCAQKDSVVTNSEVDTRCKMIVVVIFDSVSNTFFQKSGKKKNNTQHRHLLEEISSFGDHLKWCRKPFDWWSSNMRLIFFWCHDLRCKQGNHSIPMHSLSILRPVSEFI